MGVSGGICVKTSGTRYAHHEQAVPSKTYSYTTDQSQIIDLKPKRDNNENWRKTSRTEMCTNGMKQLEHVNEDKSSNQKEWQKEADIRPE